MQGYNGLNPFLQSVNSPINQKSFLPVGENYPVPKSDTNPTPVINLDNSSQYALPSFSPFEGFSSSNIISPNFYSFQSPTSNVSYVNLTGGARDQLSGISDAIGNDTSTIFALPDISDRNTADPGTVDLHFYMFSDGGTTLFNQIYFGVLATNGSISTVSSGVEVISSSVAYYRMLSGTTVPTTATRAGGGEIIGTISIVKGSQEITYTAFIGGSGKRLENVTSTYFGSSGFFAQERIGNFFNGVQLGTAVVFGRVLPS